MAAGALRTQTEDVVIRAIKASLLYLRAVEPYNGELHAAKDPDDLYRVLAGRAPSVLVYTGKSKSETIDAQRTRAVKDVDLNLVLISTSLRNREDRTRGSIGIYQIAQDIEAILVGKDSGIDGVGRLELASEEPIIHRADLCAWQVVYTVPMLAAQGPTADDTGPPLLELFGTGQLPADEGGTPLASILTKLQEP